MLKRFEESGIRFVMPIEPGVFKEVCLERATEKFKQALREQRSRGTKRASPEPVKSKANGDRKSARIDAKFAKIESKLKKKGESQLEKGNSGAAASSAAKARRAGVTASVQKELKGDKKKKTARLSTRDLPMSAKTGIAKPIPTEETQVPNKEETQGELVCFRKVVTPPPKKVFARKKISNQKSEMDYAVKLENFKKYHMSLDLIVEDEAETQKAFEESLRHASAMKMQLEELLKSYSKGEREGAEDVMEVYKPSRIEGMRSGVKTPCIVFFDDSSETR